MSIVNFYAETIGNPTPPSRIGKVRGSIPASRVGTRKALSPLARAIFTVAVLLLVLAIVSVIFAPAIMRTLGKSQVTSPPQVPAIPSPPSIADAIKSEVAKKIRDELQNAFSKKNDAREPSATGAAIPEKSIAVLPFVNMNADKNDEYLSDGMTEELINVLAKVPGLRVPGRTSCFAFKSKNEEDIFRRVGDQLHVATVLEGSVRKAGEKLRVTAQLINVSDGYHLWSKEYDGDLKDIFNFQTNVAEQVVQALEMKLGVDEKRALAKKLTENPEAHRLYLLGRYYFVKNTPEGWTNAIRYYEQALKVDPNYALAYCGLADTYSFMGGFTIPGKEAWAKEKEMAQKALALDPDLGDAHLSLGIALVSSFDWHGGENEIKRALELNPNLAFAYDAYAWVLTLSGRFGEATPQEEKELELDPLNPLLNTSVGYYLYLARRYDEATAQVRKTLELDPDNAVAHSVLGWCFIGKGNAAAAIGERESKNAGCRANI